MEKELWYFQTNQDMKETGKRDKWLDMELKFMRMETDMLDNLVKMSRMEPVFGTVLKIKLKDKENGKVEREQLGSESH
jgi:hypothetical protein